MYFKFHKVHSQPANCFIDHKECFIAPQRALYSFNKALFAVQCHRHCALSWALHIVYCASRCIVMGSFKDPMAMHLLHCLWFLTATFDIEISVSHIPGILNSSADALSRNQIPQFLKLHPQASSIPTPLPSALKSLISPRKPDWTSPSFRCNLRKLLKLSDN